MRICFFGDSIVNGTGDPDCLGWVGRVCGAARKSGVDLTSYNLGIRRDTSADILRRWRREAELDRLNKSSTWMQEITLGDGAHPGRGGYQEFAALVNGWPEWRAWLGS
jgi:lysophospholipase L1-like esterase